RLHWETDVGTLDHWVVRRCIRRQLALDQMRKSNFLPMISALQIVDTGHRLNAVIEYVDEVRRRALALARPPCDHCDAGEHVLNPMIELGDEHVFFLLRALALCDVDVDTNHPGWSPAGVVESQGARFNPPHSAA